MTIEASFLELMPSSVDVKAVTSTDAYGLVTYSGSATTTRCRIMQTGRVVKSADNRDVFEVGTVIFYGTPTVTVNSKMTLPDGSVPLILSVHVHNDEDGTHHTTVSFGN